jgi:hypothetical protein
MGRASTTTKLTVADVRAMVAGLRDITRSLAQATPAIKAAAYAELGVTVTYHQEGRALLESRPQPSDVADVRVGGETRRPARRDPPYDDGVNRGLNSPGLARNRDLLMIGRRHRTGQHAE